LKAMDKLHSLTLLDVIAQNPKSFEVMEPDINQIWEGFRTPLTRIAVSFRPYRQNNYSKPIILFITF
jgi:hypothetical protein